MPRPTRNAPRRTRWVVRWLSVRSWTVAKLYYRFRGDRLSGRPEEEIWYFAYGSNMHESAFLERRRMEPRECRVGRIPGYRLRFNLDGRPKGKSAPANIQRDADAEVWGVLYRISRHDLLRLDATEGVPGGRYRHVWTHAEDPTGQRVMVVTYAAHGNERDGNPSARYITLLRDGARARGLPEHWLTMLDNVQEAE